MASELAFRLLLVVITFCLRGFQTSWNVLTPGFVFALKNHETQLDCNFTFPQDHSYKSSVWFRNGEETSCPAKDPSAVPQIQGITFIGVFQDGVTNNLTCTVTNIYPQESANITFCNDVLHGKEVTTQNMNSDGTFIKNITVTFTPNLSLRKKICTCMVNHPNLTHILSTNITLDIQSIPQIKGITFLGILQDGVKNNMTCTVTNIYPQESANVTFCNGVLQGKEMISKMMNSDETFTKNITVTFTPNLSHHAKICTCMVNYSNLIPNQKTSITLDIQYGPRDLKMSVSFNGTIKEDDNAEFNCTANSNPVITSYKWSWVTMDNSTTVLNSSSYQLQLSSVSRRLSGKYQCEVWNVIGSSMSETYLNVQYPPDIQNSSFCIINNTKIYCLCVSEANPSANITWFVKTKENIIITPDQKRQTINIRSETTVEMYNTFHKEIFCVAENFLGNQTKSYFKETQTKGNFLWITLVGLLLGGFIFILLIVVLLYIHHRAKDNKCSPESEVEPDDQTIYAVFSNSPAAQGPQTEYADCDNSGQVTELIYKQVIFSQNKQVKPREDPSVNNVEYAAVIFHQR